MKAENLTKADKIQKSIHNLECLEKAIISKEGNRFAYLKELQSNGFFGWEIEDEELTKELTNFILSFCKNKIIKLKDEFNEL